MTSYTSALLQFIEKLLNTHIMLIAHRIFKLTTYLSSIDLNQFCSLNSKSRVQPRFFKALLCVGIVSS